MIDARPNRFIHTFSIPSMYNFLSAPPHNHKKNTAPNGTVFVIMIELIISSDQPL